MVEGHRNPEPARDWARLFADVIVNALLAAIAYVSIALADGSAALCLATAIVVYSVASAADQVVAAVRREDGTR